jgi:hypothetical protein
MDTEIRDYTGDEYSMGELHSYPVNPMLYQLPLMSSGSSLEGSEMRNALGLTSTNAVVSAN